MSRAKEWLIAVVIGALLACGVVIYLTSEDERLQKLDERRNHLTLLKDEARLFSEYSKDVFQEKISQQMKKTSTAEKKLEVIKKNEPVILLTPAGEAWKNYAIELREENKILAERIKELDLELKQSFTREDEALQALSESYRVATAYAARDKAMKVGMGLGVTLAVVGGFVGGYYASKGWVQ